MSTSAVSLLTLERLQQQVDSGSYSVVAACSRIEELIRTMCKDEMTRPFIGALPKLLSILLGDGATGAVGWIERISDESSAHSLWKLLQPTGAVFTAALSYSNGEGFPPFEIPASELSVFATPFIAANCIDTTFEATGQDRSSPPAPSLRRLSSECSEGGPPILRLKAWSLRTSTGAWLGWRLSSFFFTMLIELWLHRHDYFLKLGGETGSRDVVKVTSEPTFVLPSVDHLEALRRVARHLVLAAICPVPDHIPPQLVRFYEQLTEYKNTLFDLDLVSFGFVSLPSFAFVPFRLHLYRLLRLCLANCPSDHTIVPLGSLWLDFIAPWRYINLDLGENPDEQWSNYVGGNYFFYHTLASSFLDHVESITEGFGIAVGKGSNPPTTATASAVTLPLETAQNVLLPLLIVFGKVLSAVGSFVGLLREIEATELDLGGRRGDASTSTMGSVHQISTRPLQGTAQYRIKEQMSALEAEAFHIELLFGVDSIQRALRILYWLEAIYMAIPGALNETKGKAASGGFLHENGHSSDYDIHAVIMQCEEELCEVFSIGEQDFLLFSSRFDAAATGRRHLAATNGTNWTRRRKVIAPAMDPDAKVRQKMQITNGDERVIKSYELPLLVTLTNALSDFANKQWAQLMQLEELGRLPGFIRNIRFNFRFLAAYPNLLFIFGTLLAFRISLWLLRVALL